VVVVSRGAGVPPRPSRWTAGFKHPARWPAADANRPSGPASIPVSPQNPIHLTFLTFSRQEPD